MKSTRLNLSVILILCACSPFSSHRDIVEKELNRVSYDNGIAITEAKAIADAYLFLYAQHIGPAAYVQIRDGGDAWEGDVFAGVGISPKAVASGPVRVNKTTGAVIWDQGPQIARVDMNRVDLPE